MADPPPKMEPPEMETPNIDHVKMDMTHINGLRMQNSCIRVMLIKEKERTAYLERQSHPTSTSSEPSEVTAEDINSCVKVLRYLKDNARELDAGRFRDVTECAEAAYRSRIVLAFIAMRTKYKENAGAGAGTRRKTHILRSLDAMKRGSCRIHTPGKPGKQYIPSSAELLALDEQARQQEDEGEAEDEESTQGRRIEEAKGEQEGEGEATEGEDFTTSLGSQNEHESKEDGGSAEQKKEDSRGREERGVRDVCHRAYTKLHFFYSSMCVSCAEINYDKRLQSSDLHGKVALKLLRCGATVIVTTRFPRHALLSFAKEPDFGDWRDRLKLFVDYVLANFSELHILVNNAAQTVARPPEYFQALYRLEATPLNEDSRRALCILPATPSDITESQAKEIIADGIAWEGEILDVRERNSWQYEIGEISTAEMMEVQAVNVIAPFVLCSRLKEIMAQTQGMKFIINVSAMEGKFYRFYKSTTHPHTTLNMMTRTSAPDFVKNNIFMNSVDPGWVSNVGGGFSYEKFANGQTFTAPIDVTDAASRVCDPIFRALNGTGAPVFGLFLKDYSDTQW